MNTWILVANAHRARCFARTGAHGALTELADFVYPQKKITQPPVAADMTGEAGKGHGRTGHSGTQFEPHTSVQEKDCAAFARTLADYINQGSTAHQFNELALIASGPMLGTIKPLLSPQASQRLGRTVASDITHWQGPELIQHIERALAQAD